MELIHRWLAGKRNYHVGAVLYGQLGADPKLKQLFNTPPDKYKQARLAKELAALLDKPRELLQARVHRTDDDQMARSNDPVLEALRNEWMKHYMRMQYLRHELDRYEGNEPTVIAQRKPIAFEVLSLEKQCMQIWARRDHYLEHGKLPEVSDDQEPLPDDPVELGRLIANTERNIRRNKLSMKRNPGNVVYPLKLKHYQELLDRIMKTINNGKAAGK